jgi:cellulose synthase/poly-beta-1,6-N-acetylglucosamine synthase-like glycosyltransferase
MTWEGILADLILAFNRYVIYYFTLLNGVYLLLFLVSLAEVLRFVRRTFFSDYEQILRSEMTWPISVVVPAHNEARTIVETVRSLLGVNYGEFEVVVVNDGSTDATLQRLVEAFELKRTDRIYRKTLPTAPVRGIYASLEHPGLVVVDKEWAGKADALNAGINVSRYPLFCSVDADSIIEENALLRVVKPFMEHPREMVAVGGIVRIVNGCRVHEGRVVRIGLPGRALPVFQVVEYLRAFLGGRIGWSALRSLLIVSGAFGLYRKSEVIAVGGYDLWSETEDLELVLKLHERLRREKRRYRIVFVPDPVCWTEVPGTFGVLARQRNRWHRGLLLSLWRHKGMIFNPRYGVIGAFALPYFVLFEMFGPFVEILGYVVVPLAYFLGLLNVDFFLLFLVLAIFFGVFLSVAAVLLEEISFRRYPGWEHLAILVIAGVVENFGYRQVLALFKVKAFFDFLRRRRGWGRMDREGFRRSRPPAAPPDVRSSGAPAASDGQTR